MYEYEWVWEGQTQKGYCQWWTEDGMQGGTAWTQALENDIIERTKATYYSTIVGEFVKQCKEQGIDAELISVNVECEIVKDPLQKSGYFVARGERYHTNYSQPFYVKVKGIVVFRSEKDLMQSPIAPALIIAIAKAIAIVVSAIIISWGVYEFLRNLTLNETRSVVTKKGTITNPSDEPVTITLPDGSQVTIPPGGTYDYSETEDITKKEPSWTSWIGLGILAIVGIAGFYALSSMKKGKRKE
jgi:preprotein translocase subunit Sec61beta